MKFYKPKFWDKRGHISLISILLFPISLIIIIKNYYEESKPKKIIMISEQFVWKYLYWGN